MFLAYKLMTFNEERRYFHPPTLPEWRMPGYSVIEATCEHDHAIPAENCNCGIHLTTELASLKPWLDMAVPMEENVLVFTFQVLGRVLYEPTSKIVRAERVFPYSVVMTDEGHGRDWIGRSPRETAGHPLNVARDMRIIISDAENTDQHVYEEWQRLADRMRSGCPSWLKELIRSWKPMLGTAAEDQADEDASDLSWILGL